MRLAAVESSIRSSLEALVREALALQDLEKSPHFQKAEDQRELESARKKVFSAILLLADYPEEEFHQELLHLSLGGWSDGIKLYRLCLNYHWVYPEKEIPKVL